MSIEKTKTMKFQLQVESLETSLQQMVRFIQVSCTCTCSAFFNLYLQEQDKQQLSQLCEELMEQLEAKNA